MTNKLFRFGVSVSLVFTRPNLLTMGNLCLPQEQNSRSARRVQTKDFSIQSLTLYGPSTTKPPVTSSTEKNKDSLLLKHQIDNTIPGGDMRLNRRE